MVFFNNLTSSVTSLFENKFKPLGSTTVSVRTHTKSGANLFLKGKKKNGSEEVSGGLVWNQTFIKDDLNIDVFGNITENGTLSEEVTLRGLASGVKVTVDATLIPEKETRPLNFDLEKEKKIIRNSLLGKVTVERDVVGANFSVYKKQLNKPVLSLDVATEINNNIAFGVKVKGDLAKIESDAPRKKILDTDFTCRLRTDDISVVAGLNDAGRNVSLGIVTDVNPELTVGVQFKNTGGIPLPWCFKGVNTEAEQDAVSKPRKWSFALAASKRLDNNATLTGRVNNNGVATVAYDFDLKNNIRASIVGESSLRKVENVKLGFAVAYSG